MYAYTLNMLFCHKSNPLFIFILVTNYQEDIIICSFLWSMIRTLHMFATDKFKWLIVHVIIYLYVLRKYYRTHEDGGVLGYPTQDSIYKIPSRKYKIIFLEKFLPRVSHYFCTLIILNWKCEIITIPQIDFRII